MTINILIGAYFIIGLYLSIHALYILGRDFPHYSLVQVLFTSIMLIFLLTFLWIFVMPWGIGATSRKRKEKENEQERKAQEEV